MTRMKMCGITQMSETEIVNELKPDFVGFVMYFPKSKRNLEPEKAAELMAAIRGDIKKVAVVVAPDAAQIAQMETMDFDYIQIHGMVPDELIENSKHPVLKAFNVKDIDTYSHIQSLKNVAGYVFDAGEPGSGKVFDWDMLKTLERDDRMFILAGGLNPDNVAHAIEIVNPDVVDVSSGIEYEERPGKDPVKMRAFAEAVRNSLR